MDAFCYIGKTDEEDKIQYWQVDSKGKSRMKGRIRLVNLFLYFIDAFRLNTVSNIASVR